jgi:flagellar basal-body rod modification protein FlgD
MTVTPLTTAAPASSSGGSSGSETAPTNPDGMLGQNDFLKLMVAQLEAQNPLEPGNSNEYINELATFTNVEQMTNLADANELQSAVQMIGHKVAFDNAKGVPTTGTVESVQSNSEGTTVTIATSSEGAAETGVKLSALTNIE